MKYVNQGLFELKLPDDWAKIVADAEKYVKEKEDGAHQDAVAAGKTDAEIAEIIRRIRASAINAKSEVWSKAGRIAAKIMYEKCWYCECKETRSDLPVDHFRPKNRVAGQGTHPGYWWLAFRWQNYRYACTFCNSHRIDPDGGTAGGKQDHFPLMDESQRAWDPTFDLDIERPELLDPCDVDVHFLLTFHESGLAAEAFKKEKDAEKYQRANISIKLYHLDHQKAKRERKAIAIAIREKVRRINALEGLDPKAKVDKVLKEIKDIKRDLVSLIYDRAEFCTAARIYLRGFRNVDWVCEILDRF